MPTLDATMWPYGVLVVVLAAAAIDDIRTSKIHNWITYPTVLIGLTGHCLDGFFFEGQRLGILGALGGMFAGFIPMFIAWKAGGVGGGDAKLLGAVGALTGWKFAVATMFYGFAVAVVMALAIMLRRRIVRRTLGRIWWFVTQVLVRDKVDDPSSSDSPSIAIGLAMAIGAIIAMMDLCFDGPMTNMLFGAG